MIFWSLRPCEGDGRRIARVNAFAVAAVVRPLILIQARTPEILSMDEIECVVIGGGVVGLAVARELALAGREVVLLEAGPTVGCGISSRNSEVIHAGLYYPAGSLKAALCVRGRALLYAYCEQHGVPYRRCGKLLVATGAEQLPRLEALSAGAQVNGVHDLRRLSAAEAQQFEPALRCVAALYSPDTGIVDSHQLMLALQGDAQAAGAVCAFRATLEDIELDADGRFVLTVGDGWEAAADKAATGAPRARSSYQLSAARLFNCAGLQANALARAMRGAAAQGMVRRVPPLYLARGNYFSLSGRSPFRHLIYPMPDQAGLGVHLTLDLGGQAKFGPDVEWVDTLDYDVDPRRADSFYASIRAYWPALPDGALQPAYSGIRPKLAAAGQPAADFMVQGEREHGVPGLLNLFGIESPGLTAALALAEYVMTRI
jgi:L-2-hydroxyglutarate oxidase LhgO